MAETGSRTSPLLPIWYHDQGRSSTTETDYREACRGGRIQCATDSNTSRASPRIRPFTSFGVTTTKYTENWLFRAPHRVIPTRRPADPLCHSDPEACRGGGIYVRSHSLHSPPRRSTRFLVANDAPRNDEAVSFRPRGLPAPSVIPTPRLAEGEESTALKPSEFTTPTQYQIPRRIQRSSE
jgi:hypothetical protein